MVKFRCLIHKETGTVIKYEEWKETLLESVYNSIFIKTDSKTFEYKTKEILFSDDFEIVYDSEFTLQELYKLYGLSGDLAPKIAKSINEKEALFTRYGIEV